MHKTLADNGIEVRQPDQALKDGLRAATAVMRDEWLDSNRRARRGDPARVRPGQLG